MYDLENGKFMTNHEYIESRVNHRDYMYMSSKYIDELMRLDEKYKNDEEFRNEIESDLKKRVNEKHDEEKKEHNDIISLKLKIHENRIDEITEDEEKYLFLVTNTQKIQKQLNKMKLEKIKKTIKDIK